jgi:hypothetical protein
MIKSAESAALQCMDIIHKYNYAHLHIFVSNQSVISNINY